MTARGPFNLCDCHGLKYEFCPNRRARAHVLRSRALSDAWRASGLHRKARA